MIYLGDGRYLDLPLAAFVIALTLLFVLPPWLAWRWAKR